jgi:hypothetical protein
MQPCCLMGYRVVRSFRASRESNLGLNAIAPEVKRGRQVEYCDDGIGADLAISEFVASIKNFFVRKVTS